MSVTKQARRSDSLMYDEWVSRQTLCDMVARTERDLKEVAAALPGPSLVLSGDVTDEELKEKWIDDTKVWSDVFVAKPYEYMQLIIDKKVPWFDRSEGKWVAKKDFKKEKDDEDKAADEAEKSFSESTTNTDIGDVA